MTETYNVGTKARVDGTNPPSSGISPCPAVVLPDSVCCNTAALQQYARTGQSFLAKMPDGSLQWMRIAAGAGGMSGETVIQSAGSG